VVTDLAYFDIDRDGFMLRELAPGVSVDDVRSATAARFRVSPEVCEMQFA
jgi:3-oxoacid CoA-transferase subunit B